MEELLMRFEDNKRTYFFSRNNNPQNYYELHLLNVFIDPEFLNDINKLSPNRSTYLKKINNCKVVSEKLNIFSELEKELKKINKVETESIINLYAIKKVDLYLFLNGQYEVQKVNRKGKVPFLISVERTNPKKIDIQIKWEITKNDFNDIWGIVSALKKEKFKGIIPKIKTPENDKLLYAIFKAVKRKEAFSKIYMDYEKGKLIGYNLEKNLSKKRFNNEESLYRYFNKYNPKNFQDT